MRYICSEHDFAKKNENDSTEKKAYIWRYRNYSTDKYHIKVTFKEACNAFVFVVVVQGATFGVIVSSRRNGHFWRKSDFYEGNMGAARRGPPSIIYIYIYIYTVTITFNNNNNYLTLGTVRFFSDKGFSRWGLLPPILGGTLKLANLPTPVLPNPSFPALCCQDTSFTWRPAYAWYNIWICRLWEPDIKH